MSALPEMVETRDGRKLSLREIDPADTLDLIEAAGSALNGASATTWLAYAQMICSVTAIDGVPVQMPMTKAEVRELARRVGNAGVAALEPLFSRGGAEGSDEVAVAKN